MTPDMVNGLFEIFGAFVLCFNVKQIRKDRAVKGINPWTTVFFTTWGMWNLYYYPSLEQWWSFYGGLAIVIVNTFWLIHVIVYWQDDRKKAKIADRFNKRRQERNARREKKKNKDPWGNSGYK